MDYYTKDTLLEFCCSYFPDPINKLICDYSYAEKYVLCNSFSLSDINQGFYEHSICIFNDYIYFCYTDHIACYHFYEKTWIANFECKLNFPLLIPKNNNVYVYERKTNRYKISNKITLNNELLDCKKRKYKLRIFYETLSNIKNVKSNKEYILCKGSNKQYLVRLSGKQLISYYSCYKDFRKQIQDTISSQYVLIIKIEYCPYWIKMTKHYIYGIYLVHYIADHYNKIGVVQVQIDKRTNSCISCIPISVGSKKVQFYNCATINHNHVTNILIKTVDSNMIYEFTKVVY